MPSPARQTLVVRQQTYVGIARACQRFRHTPELPIDRLPINSGATDSSYRS